MDTNICCPLCQVRPENINTYYRLCNECEKAVSGNSRQNEILTAAAKINSSRIAIRGGRETQGTVLLAEACQLLAGAAIYNNSKDAK